MSSTVDAPPTHPLVDFTTAVNGVLDRLTEAPAWSLTPQEQQSVVVGLTRALSRIEEVRLRVLACGDRADLAAQTAASSTTAWLAHATRVPAGQAHGDVQLATALDTHLAQTRAALSAGTVNTDQARVISTAVQALAAAAVEQDPSLPGLAEKHLLDLAADHDARTLKRLARHVLHVLDPDAADQALGRRLEAEERAAAAATSLVLRDNGDGTHAGRFTLDTLHTAMLTTALEAFTHPTHTHGEGTTTTPGGTAESSDTAEPDGTAVRRLPRPELLGRAFGELIERLDPARLPTAGGVNATIVVTLDYDSLLSGLGTAHLDTGQATSAGLARRLACEAGVIPAVVRRLIDGTSVVLDMGRNRRLHTETQRIALAIEQGGCTADGCTRPPAWCHAHHDTPGTTAAPPASTTAASSAPSTTEKRAARTTTPPTCPTAASPSTDAPRPTCVAVLPHTPANVSPAERGDASPHRSITGRSATHKTSSALLPPRASAVPVVLVAFRLVVSTSSLKMSGRL